MDLTHSAAPPLCTANASRLCPVSVCLACGSEKRPLESVWGTNDPHKGFEFCQKMQQMFWEIVGASNWKPARSNWFLNMLKLLNRMHASVRHIANGCH